MPMYYYCCSRLDFMDSIERCLDTTKKVLSSLFVPSTSFQIADGGAEHELC